MLKLNVDTADRTVVVPNQLFVSTVSSRPSCSVLWVPSGGSSLCV